MADTPYKGLTIRFGADTTEFTSRMSALRKVISETQARINALNKAMRGNPETISALTAKFNMLREQAANAAVRVDSLRRGIAEMKAAGIEKLAASVKDTALAYQRADRQVVRVNQALRDQYARLEAIGKQVGVTFSKEKLEKFYREIEKSDKASASLKLEVRGIAEQVNLLKKRHEQLDQARTQAKRIHEFKTMKEEALEAELELEGFVRKVVEAKERMQALTATNVQLDKLGNEFKELKSEGQSLASELGVLKSALAKNGDNAQAYSRAVEVLAERIKNAARTTENLEEQLEMRRAQTGVKRIVESMTQLKAGVESAREGVYRAEKALAEYRSQVDVARQKWESLDRGIRMAVSRTKEISDEHRKWLGLTKEQEQEYRQLKAIIDGSSDAVKKLEQKAKLAGEELAMKKARVAQKELETSFSKESAQLTLLTTKVKGFGAAALNSLRDFATGLGATIGPSVLMLGMHIVNAGDQIDSAFRDMKKTVDGTAEDFEHLREAAIEFSRTHPVSADTILEIEAMGGQLGIAVENLEEFARVVSNLDIATNMNADDIAIDLGKLANVLHVSTEEYESFADSLVRLGNNFPALESDVMNITTRFAGMATIVGVLPDEVLAISTAATATGQKADAAGGSLQRTFGRIEGAVAGVSDAMRNLDELTEEEIADFEAAKDKLSAYSEIAGLSAEEFARLWETNERLEDGMTGTTKAFKLFVEGLKRINDEGGSVDATLMSLGITGVRDRQLLEGLTNTTAILDDALRQSRDAWGDVANGISSGGDAAREAANRAEGFSGKLKMLKNTAQTMGDAFANKLVPLMDKLLDVLRAIAPIIDNMDEGMASMITVSGGLAVAMGPVLRIFSQTKITFDQFRQAAQRASMQADALAKAQGESAKVTKAMLQNSESSRKGLEKLVASLGAAKIAAIALAAVGIAALVIAVQNYYKEQEKLRKATVGLSEVLYQTSDAAKDNADTFDKGGTAYVSCSKQIKALIDDHAKLYDEMRKTVTDTDASIRVMERYVSIMKENDGVAADNIVGAQRLKDAVKTLNEQYGLGISVVEENNSLHVVGADGARLEADAIDALVEAKRREIEINAIAEMQTELVKQQIKDEEALAEAKEQVAIAQDELNKAYDEGDDLVMEYKEQLDKAIENENLAQQAYDGTTAALESLDARYVRVSESTDENGRRVKELAAKYPVLAEKLDRVSNHAFADFMDALADAGYDTKALEKLSTYEISVMTEAWANGTNTWMHSMDVASDRMQQDVRKTDSVAEVAFQSMKTAVIAEISEMTGVSVGELEKLADEAGANSELAMRKWVDNIKDAAPESGRAMGDSVDLVESELNRAVEAASDAGWNVTSGFAYGMQRSAYLAVAAARSVVNQAIRAGNDEAAIGSPSKKTMWSGRMVDQGWIVGMEKDADAVAKQSAIVAGLATGSQAAARSASLGYLSGRAAASFGTTNNTTNNSTANEYVNITLNVEARDLQDVKTIDEIVTMAQRARAQYARKGA